jgi:hypothetical protein
MTLTLKGAIKRFIDVLPTDRVYLSGMFGETIEKEVSVVSEEMGPGFEISGITSNIDDKITYKVLPAADPGTYRLRIWKNPKLPVIKTWGSITLNTNSSHSPQKVIQVNVTTNSLIKAQPSIINFGRIAIGGPQEEAQTYKKTITVSKLKGEFNISDVTFSKDNYSATVETVEAGRTYKLTIQFKPDHTRRQYSDEMTVNTDDPMEPKVTVRLIARSI